MRRNPQLPVSNSQKNIRRLSNVAELKTGKISLEQLMVSPFAMTDALAKLMIRQGLIIDEELKASTAKRGAGE